LLGNVWVEGSTASLAFPMANGYLGTYAGGPYDAFLTEIEVDPLSIIRNFTSSLEHNDYRRFLKPWEIAALRDLLEHWDRVTAERMLNKIATRAGL
jgi:hypothetical protein